MTNSSQLTAGINFPWKYVTGYFMKVHSFTPLTQFFGDKVGSPILGKFGIISAELPNPDVESNQRILALPIENKSDFKSISKAYLDSGIINGANELILVYENRRNLFGRPKACFHFAIYPDGTWIKFFEAVSKYASQEFKLPNPLILFQPSVSDIFPTSKNIFTP
jgi:hypothetical protein